MELVLRLVVHHGHLVVELIKLVTMIIWRNASPRIRHRASHEAGALELKVSLSHILLVLLLLDKGTRIVLLFWRVLVSAEGVVVWPRLLGSSLAHLFAIIQAHFQIQI